MLISLSVNHFAIAEQLQVDFNAGMTAITGETGAGKSIALDALGLALGNRGDSSMIQHGHDKADIHALFYIQALPAAQNWLLQHELHDADNHECILRRVISREGRSRAYINGKPCNLSVLAQLGRLLVDIHSQHAQHQLFNKEHHQTLLDAYCREPKLLEQSAKAFRAWQTTQTKIKRILDNNNAADSRKDYLAYQLQEFDTLAIEDNEYPQLEAKHQELAHAADIADACQLGLFLCRDGDTNIHTQLSQALAALAPLSQHSNSLSEADTLLQ